MERRQRTVTNVMEHNCPSCDSKLVVKNVYNNNKELLIINTMCESCNKTYSANVINLKK